MSKYQVENMDDSQRNELDDKIKSHSIGPVKLALEFKRYVTNGMMFRIRDSENGKSTQNSGVCVSTEDDTPYYGQLTRIIEVQYYDGSRYVLFKCDWANIALGRGYKNDEYGFILVNFSRLIHTGERITDDPFVLASQVSQVYYVADERILNWVVGVTTKPRDVFDVGQGRVNDDDVDNYCDTEPFNFNIEAALEDAIDNLVWARNDIEGITLNTPEELREEIHHGESQHDPT
jgi:hypothetical protein